VSDLKEIWSDFGRRAGIALTQQLADSVVAELRRAGDSYDADGLHRAYERLKRQEFQQRFAPKKPEPQPQSEAPAPATPDESADPNFPQQGPLESSWDFQKRKTAYREGRAKAAWLAREEQRLRNQPLNADVRRRTEADAMLHQKAVERLVAERATQS
jgi:hypothetical protein